MPRRLTTPTTLEAGLCPSEVGRRVGQWKCETAPSTPPGSRLSFWTQRMPPSFRDNPPGGKLHIHTGRSLQYPRERLLRNLDRTARNSPSAVTPQPFHSTSATLYSHTRRPPPHPVSPRSPPRFGEGPPPTQAPRYTHTLRLQPPGPRRRRSEYLVWPCSGTQMGRAQSPPGGADCFSTHPQRCLLSFPGKGGRRGAGGEGEGEEPRGG